MIPLKSIKEIKIMRQGGKKLALVMREILVKVKPGMKLKKIDYLANQLITKQSGKPSFKMVKDYHWATCLNVNQGVVHGVPNSYKLKEGDLLSIDIGICYRGWHADMARTLWIRTQNAKFKIQNDKFLEAGKKALTRAIKVAKPGNRIGHISNEIEKSIKRSGYQPIKVLTGHGIGRKLHEAPTIPCYLKGKIETTEKLESGTTLAIEVIYTQGKPDVVVKSDGWTTETVDGKLAALFEDTVAVTKQGPLILTCP